MSILRCAGLMMLAMLALAPLAHAQDSKQVHIVYLALTIKRVWPHSFLDQPPADEGVQGARLGLADNATTGRFLNQSYDLEEMLKPDPDTVLSAFRASVAAGNRLFVLDLPAALLLQVADLPEAQDSILIDATDTDDMLRAEGCRRNVLHMLPSRAMLADALMQYLVVKNWRNILLVVGPQPADQLYGEALRRSAHKFQVHIVADKPWTFQPGARRTDTGHFAVQDEVARFTQGFRYDVLVVADEADNFGDDLSYHTTDPRPVAGTQGLTPSAWARPFEQWGATQLQNRFVRQAGRWATDHDVGAWMALRAIGEAATRTGSMDPHKIIAFLHSKDFQLAGFKGAPLSVRPWDGQLRQPVLLATDRTLVSVSPQPGFLHQFSEMDTLGIDQPETKCHMN
jgi:ABC transporter substrate binding protein (PQQ-dependent alcohol dehydrogenase system)